MKILFVVDGRSPIALNWMRYFVEAGHETHLASSFACQPELDFASLHIIPVALSGAAPAGGAGGGAARKLLPTALRTRARQLLGPLTLGRAARQLREVIDNVQPDLIHAMRIPYEGMLAAAADPAAPLLVSVWGNDFTLHGPSTARMRGETQRTMVRANALHCDNQRDVRLAAEWGFDPIRPTAVLPGGGGVQAELFYPPAQPAEQALVVNPRGLRAYVRNDIFFQAVPKVLAEMPEARFECVAMQGQAEAERWLAALGIGDAVSLLPKQSRAEMAALFRRAQVAVSPSTHDGTPNTLLEAMACGCFPVAGDIESLREWIQDGDNGLLVDPTDADALAAAMLRGLRDNELRQRAAERNQALIAERAEYGAVMAQAERFYEEIVRS